MTRKPRKAHTNAAHMFHDAFARVRAPTDKQTDRKTDRQKDRQTDRHSMSSVALAVHLQCTYVYG